MLFSIKLHKPGAIMCRKLTVKSSMKRVQNTTRTFEEAEKALNALQSNRKTIQNSIFNKGIPHNEFSNTLVQVEKYLARVDLPLNKLDQLPVIHVAGTKGKGSTCALCESILRQHGFKTGFFSSPHILDVCERIRINGLPISHEKFAGYFWYIYDKLDRFKENEDDMPHYFRILTIVAFHLFLEEKVDVALIEVGIGGQYDCTNILRNVPVAGITSLGLDHTDLLGDTLEKIAWQKAGIMKPASKVFTLPQTNSALQVLREQSIERKCTLEVVEPTHIQISKQINAPFNVFSFNVSLAVAMAKQWISLKGETREFNEDLAKQGIENCSWPGRYQIIPFNGFNFHVDGAHTPESIKLCADWFSEKTNESTNKKVLIFNTTGNRNPEVLLSILSKIPFDYVFFTPNVAYNNKEVDRENDGVRCQIHYKVWMNLSSTSNTMVCSSVNGIFSHLSSTKPYDVLVTGSLYLVSAVLRIIDPNLKCK